MSDDRQPTFQREKANKVLQVYITQTEMAAVITAANESSSARSVSDWARENLVRPLVVRKGEQGRGRL